MKLLSRKELKASVLLLGAAAMMGGCSHDLVLDHGDEEPVTVAFSTFIADARVMRSAQSQGDVSMTSRGVTTTGLHYTEYVAADGFLTRAVMPPVPGHNAMMQEHSQVQTRTTTGGREWVMGDAVGIFMLSHGDTLAGGIVVEADNIEYRATPGTPASQATFAPANASETIYYPGSGTVDFIAYYPYGGRGTAPGQVTDTHIYKVSVAGQDTAEGQASIDVLYSHNVTDKTRSKTEVAALQFEHALSKVVINVKAGDGLGSTDLTVITASLTGFPTTADLSLANGTISNPDEIGDIVPLRWSAPSDSHYKATFEAILIPQPVGGTSRTLLLTVNGEAYRWTLNESIAFRQGEVHTYEVTMKRSGITVVADPTITPWTVTSGAPTPGTTKLMAVETVKINSGTFQMGSPAGVGNDAEKPQHWVRLSKDFHMSKYEITNAQYAAFLNANLIGSDGKWASGQYPDQKLLFATSSYFDFGLRWVTNKWIPVSGCEDNPIIYVTWYGAAEYARWVGGSLPTEAQWEYACRAGTTTSYSYGDTANGDYMWYIDNDTIGGYPSGTKPVGLKIANSWGLYDMHGNVDEWCLDQWDGTSGYPTAETEEMAVVDPLGTTGDLRIRRGGGWLDQAVSCRTALRRGIEPNLLYYSFGFRVVFNL